MNRNQSAVNRRFRTLVCVVGGVIAAACARTEPSNQQKALQSVQERKVVTSRIRTIDFKSMSYPFIEPEPGPSWDMPSSSETIELKDGDYRFSDGGYLKLVSVTYGDLDGDGREEVAVDLLHGTGGTQ